ncbi:MAG: PqqD family protein [Clostridia bacterium]|nr:PqqD family protein [Clostridia bacterium]
MRLKCKFVINTIAGETVAVPVGDQNALKGYIRLNETGKDIFELLEKETEREKIIADMMIKYPDATQAEICESVDGIIEKLSAAELLV